MSLSRSGPGRRPNQKPTEILDLTLSPSPEPQPRRLAHQQPTYPKMEPKTWTDVKKEEIPAHRSTRPGPAGRPAKQINPNHLSRIINTSDPHALRTVLLNLCKVSPALSGAVARGLAPHSTFAQATITRYCRRRPATPNIKPDPGRARSSSPMSDSSSLILLSSPKIKSHIKHERKPSPAPSNGSSSNAFSDAPLTVPSPKARSRFRRTPTPGPASLQTHRLAGSKVLPIDMQRATCSRDVPPSRSALTNRNTNSAAGTPSQRIMSPPEPNDSTMECWQCSEPFQEGSTGVCFYHPLHTELNDFGVPKYICCQQLYGSPGCEIGSHVAEPPEDKPPKESRPPKRPRLY